MALVALTKEQKEILKNNSRFASNCKWAMMDKARLFINSDGETTPGSCTRIKWATFRFLGAGYLANPSIIDNDTVRSQIAAYATGNIWDNAVVFGNGDITVDYLVTNSLFDTYADSVFTDRANAVTF